MQCTRARTLAGWLLALFLVAAGGASPAGAQGGGAEGAPVGSAREQFVTRLFFDQLGRDPTLDELNAQVGLLNDGTSRSQLVGSFQGTTDFRTAVVGGSFQTILQRPATDQEMAFFLAGINRGSSFEDVATNLLASPDFFANNGGTNNGFLQGLFQDVLGRPIGPQDAAQVQQFNRLLRTGNRTAVIRLLANTRAARENLIRGQFLRLLGRQPTTAELNFWVAQFQRGRRIADLMASLTASDEFFARADMDAATLWIQRLFTDLLGRSPSEGEIDTALSGLLRGATFFDVAADLLTSDEYYAVVVETQFVRLLGRQPTAAELQQWARFLKNRGRVQQIIAAIIGSEEYFRTQGGSTASGFLQAVYQDLLGRDTLPRDAAQVRDFTRLIQARIPRIRIPQLLENTRDFRVALVEQFYTRFLGRSPSSAELNAWVTALARGGAQRIVGRDIIVALVSSDEYYNLGQ